MEIIIDIIWIIILVLSAFVGYKKGLVKLGAGLLAGLISIIIILIIYKPVSRAIINNTPLDEKIENIIIEKSTNLIDEKTKAPNAVTETIEKDVIKKQANDISKKIVGYLIAIVLFVLIKIALSIIITLLDLVAKLPIIKQFNEIGGAIYGILKGTLIVCICVFFIGVFTKINPQSKLNNKISETYLTKTIYEKIIRF